ncbi:MAG: penicillin-binding transpeptidase domain-containing protein [Cytophagales bacterium]|nr:penicillin-binding transpeptidase domain-containing protein [Cytophagales bacterium]
MLQGLILVSTLLLSIILFHIQVKDNSYVLKAERNIVQRMVEYPRRGFIYDREDQILVYNVPAFDVKVVPQEVKSLDTLHFSQVFNLSLADFRESWKRVCSYSMIQSSTFISDISHEEFSHIQDEMISFPGFYVEEKIIRGYTYPFLANTLGYVNEVSPSQLAKDSLRIYELGDPIGVSGLEEAYDLILRGEKGTKFRRVDVRGKDLGPFKQGVYDRASKPGEDIQITIDTELQRYAEFLMEGKRGSVLAIEPETGEILAIVSAPSYDPNQLSGKNYGKYYDLISSDSLTPLFHRPLMAMYRPGSIFKVAQALVALELGLIDPETVFPCDQNLIGCHWHGLQEDLRGAITNSCNSYFYRVMERYIYQDENPDLHQSAPKGLEKWHKAMKRLAFGKKTGIDIPSEQKGYIPNVSYYDRIYGQNRWNYETIYSLAIGEGENLVVPLQMVNFAAMIANRGYYYTPHLLRKTSRGSKREIQKHSIHIDPRNVEIVVQAMREVILSGTGRYRANLPDIEVCGKTGTVQNREGEFSHSVFISFAPMESPQIALSVYVEYAGEGARAAAAISGLLIEKYLKKEEAKLYYEAYVRNFIPE